MENDHIKQILTDIENGRLSASEGYAKLKISPLRISAMQKWITTAKYGRVLLKSSMAQERQRNRWRAL